MDHLIDRARRKVLNKKGKFRVCAICFGRGKFLGIAYNYPRFFRKGGGVHAEMMALHRWGEQIDVILLVRFGRGGNLLPINPCPSCEKILNKLKINVVLIPPG